MTTDFYLRIRSETKTFTVTALLGLIDRHRIRLDDPISRYVHGVPNGHRITLRQLAEMRSGLFPNGAEFPEPHPRGCTDQTLSGAVADAMDWNPSWAWAAGAMISNLNDLRRWRRSSPPVNCSAPRPRPSA